MKRNKETKRERERKKKTEVDREEELKDGGTNGQRLRHRQRSLVTERHREKK